MPLPLNMFDDYQDSSILTALDVFQHIITNTVSIGFGIYIISNSISLLPCTLKIVLLINTN